MIVELRIIMLHFNSLPLYLCGMDAIFTLGQVRPVAMALWKEAKAKKVWAFHAPMGTGKTTFIHALCELKNVKDAISSPTFSIINEYEFEENGYTKKFFHIDLYRLQNEEEAIKAGVEDCLLSGNICFIEWAEKAPGILPGETVNVFIEILNDERRRLKIEGI